MPDLGKLTTQYQHRLTIIKQISRTTVKTLKLLVMRFK